MSPEQKRAQHRAKLTQLRIEEAATVSDAAKRQRKSRAKRSLARA